MPEIHFVDVATYYKGLPHQKEALQLLQAAMPDSLLKKKAAWYQKWIEEPSAPADYPNTWEGVAEAAQACGARWPQLVAAQWALESAHGTATSGKNNYMGLKGSGSSHLTEEEVDGRMVTITAGFIDFPTLKDCVNYLVVRWYLDYKGYKGVNHAPSAEAAAWELRNQGYATDSHYPQKLIRLMHDHGAA